MKRIIQCLLIAIFPFSLSAQTYTNKDKAAINARIDTLLKSFMEKSTLTEPGVSKLSTPVCKQFKNLFDRNALIFDDINPDIDSVAALWASENPYVLKNRKLEDYYNGLMEQFSTGIIINNKHVNISYDNFNQGTVSVALERVVEAKTYKGYKFRNEDTLMINIAIQPDKTVKIASIQKIGSKFQVMNDRDFDGVIDANDECPDQKGKRVFKGCPDTDDDGVPDKDDECANDSGPISNSGCPPSTFAYRFVFAGSTGPSLNKNVLKTPELSSLGYAELDKTRSRQGTVSDEGMVLGLSLNASVAYYIGRNKNNRNKGISFGVSYMTYKATYTLNDIHYEYMSSDGNSNYRRMFTLENGSTEKISFTIFNFPLQFRIKSKIGTGSKLAWELSAGPSFMVINASTSAYNATYDLEGIYQFDAGGHAVYNQQYVASSRDVVIAKQQFNTQKSGSLTDLNSKLNEASAQYDFTPRSPTPVVNGTPEALKSRSGIAINLGADIFYHLNPKLAVKGGLSFISASLSNSNDKFMMMDKSTDSYKSFYNSSSSSTYTSYGFNVGIIIGI